MFPPRLISADMRITASSENTSSCTIQTLKMTPIMYCLCYSIWNHSCRSSSCAHLWWQQLVTCGQLITGCSRWFPEVTVSSVGCFNGHWPWGHCGCHCYERTVHIIVRALRWHTPQCCTEIVIIMLYFFIRLLKAHRCLLQFWHILLMEPGTYGGDDGTHGVGVGWERLLAFIIITVQLIHIHKHTLYHS